MAVTYTSSFDRLLALPEVFTGRELTILFGWKSAMASNYLVNWKRAGLVQALGGRSDVYMNRVRNQQVNPEIAMRRAFPGAIKVGVDILRSAGWTTQIPAAAEVAVGSQTTLYAVNDFVLTTRSPAWFLGVTPGIERASGGLDRLAPEWALADMIARAQDKRVRKAWLLDPEDLSLSSVLETKGLPKALASFGLPPDCLRGEGYAQIYQRFNTPSIED